MLMKHFVEELRWRGMLHDIMPGAEELLGRECVSGYIGFDPTAPSLGVGNLVQMMTLLHFQRCGHKPIIVLGGATGLVGDPSGKSQERNLLTKEQMMHNLECQKKQMERFLDFQSGNNKAEILNNYDWLKDFLFLDFIRDVGKHITVNYMLSKDSVQNRMATGISFTEFSYQLIQGYDFYWLNKHKGIPLQMGGSDQWGNMVTGTELIRRISGTEAFALTTPLIKKADGTKFGKSESGNIWLDPGLTSPYHFYQFWLNAADADITSFIRIFSIKDRAEIDALEQEHQKTPHLRLLQHTLAEEITTRVHGSSALQRAKEASEILFGKATNESLQQLEEEQIKDVFRDVPQFTISRSLLQSPLDAVALLAEHTAVYPSKGEARRGLQANAVSVNKVKIQLDTLITESQLLKQRYLIIQKGKKDYFLIDIN